MDVRATLQFDGFGLRAVRVVDRGALCAGSAAEVRAAWGARAERWPGAEKSEVAVRRPMRRLWNRQSQNPKNPNCPGAAEESRMEGMGLETRFGMAAAVYSDESSEKEIAASAR